MQFVFFVVFKQKTAYELRISDWSSDVCSSDLADIGLVRHQPIDFARLISILLKRGLDGFGHTNDGMAEDLPPLHPQVAGRTRAARPAIDIKHVVKIGRATCRERVCQYV